MAGFICEICGGAIKMQANKTGVCQGCGMEYDLEAIKAMAGAKAAAPVSAPAPAVPVPQADSAASDEISREALLCYLSDVRTLETVLHESESELAKLQNKKLVSELVIKTIGKAPKAPIEPAAQKFPEKDGVIGTFVCASLFVILGIIFCIAGGLGIIIGVPSLCFGVFIGITGVYGLSDYKNTKQAYQVYQQMMAEYHSDVAQYRIEERRYNSDKDRETENVQAQIDAFSTEISTDIAEEREILAKAYSANIIPVQFRNIEGVYYLYDYLSTSNQSLSEALMQANLEAIKQKLDQMIRLQSAQIIQQAQANAKLGRIMEFTEATMNNSAVAAQSAQIAAVNSAVTAKLAAEQLAYQKAEFWLK